MEGLLLAQSTTALSAEGSADYSILRTETDLGREQLECLELLLDDYSKAALRHAGIRNGLKCLEIGAGSGSIARWMTERVRPDGQVLAIDIEPSRVVSRPGLEVRKLDLNEGLPPGETFDLIHARLVLMHLRRRREIILDLISSLNPGGQLVLGEYLAPIYDPISVPEPGDEELFRKMMSTLIEKVGEPGGISYTWAREMSEILAAFGLIDIQTERHMETTTGEQRAVCFFRTMSDKPRPYCSRTELTPQRSDVSPQ